MAKKKAVGRKQPDSVVTERVALCLRYLCSYLPTPVIIQRVQEAGYVESERQIREDIKKAQRMFDELATNNINLEELRGKRVRQYEELIATQYEKGDLKEVRLILAELNEIQGLTGAKAVAVTQTTITQNNINVSEYSLEKQIELLRLLENKKEDAIEIDYSEEKEDSEESADTNS